MCFIASYLFKLIKPIRASGMCLGESVIVKFYCTLTVDLFAPVSCEVKAILPGRDSKHISMEFPVGGTCSAHTSSQEIFWYQSPNILVCHASYCPYVFRPDSYTVKFPQKINPGPIPGTPPFIKTTLCTFELSFSLLSCTGMSSSTLILFKYIQYTESQEHISN